MFDALEVVGNYEHNKVGQLYRSNWNRLFSICVRFTRSTYTERSFRIQVTKRNCVSKHLSSFIQFLHSIRVSGIDLLSTATNWIADWVWGPRQNMVNFCFQLAVPDKHILLHLAGFIISSFFQPLFLITYQFPANSQQIHLQYYNVPDHQNYSYCL